MLDATADGAEALAAATDASWAIGGHIARAETKDARSDRARFPASAVAALERLDASGDGAAAAAVASAVFEARPGLRRRRRDGGSGGARAGGTG